MHEISARKLLDEAMGLLRRLYDPEEARNIGFILLEHFWGVNKAAVLAGKTVMLSNTVSWQTALGRLLRHEPVQYVTGQTEFFGRLFDVNPNVLIPRPETEELVAWVVEENRGKAPTILDVGTGSGCIAVTLAKELPPASVWAVDISGGALQTAAGNARKHEATVVFQLADVLQWEQEPIFGGLPLDVIVSNPPYVAETEKPLMRPNVTDFEPHLALFVPDGDPLLFYRQIARLGKALLRPAGRVFLEINERFAWETAQLLSLEGYQQAEVKKDLFGKERFVKAVL